MRKRGTEGEKPSTGNRVIIGDIYRNSRRNRCVSDADAVVNKGAINLEPWKNVQYPSKGFAAMHR